ncbi:MAG: ABC transporter permease [Spirochaetia bacterium]|nr:ABC transporter permease [Spirochaetia bacterium]
MNTIIKIAFRNVSRQKRRSNLLGLAIAFGVMMIVLVNGLSQGLVKNTMTNFESILGGHVYITGNVLLDNKKISSRIENPEVIDKVLPSIDEYVKDYQKRSGIDGKFIFRSNVSTENIQGVNFSQEKELVTSLKIAQGNIDNLTNKQAIIIPDKVATQLGIVVGEELLVSFETVTGQANVGSFIVIATTDDMSMMGFSYSYAHLDYINSLIGLEEGEYQYLNLFLYNLDSIPVVQSLLENGIEQLGFPLKPKSDSTDPTERMMEQFSSSSDDEPWSETRFEVTTLNDFMEAVTQLLAILNGIALGVFLIMLVITMVGLINTFHMIMIERVKEIGTMRAVGMLKRDVSRQFIFEGVILVLRGAFFGLIAAFVVSFIVSLISFPLDSNFAFIMDKGHISVVIQPLSVFLVILIVTIITIIAVAGPARKAAKLSPADALRA